MSYTLVRSRDRGAYRATLEQEAITAGAQRARFVLVRDSGVSGALTSISYGRSRATVDVHGIVYDSGPDGDDDSGPDGDDPKAKAASETNLLHVEEIAGAAPLNKAVGALRIPCGVCLIVGSGGSGKTPLAHELAAASVDSYAVVRIGEPLSGYASTQAEAALAIAQAMVESSDIVVDSIKDLLSGGGNAMKSGISREALVVLSAWAAAACRAGVTLYVPVNASTNDKEALDTLAEAARSNATMTIISSGVNMWEFMSRRGEGLKRDSGSFGSSFDSAGTMRISGDGISVTPTTKFVTAELSTDSLQTALRRSISTNMSENQDE